MSDSRNRSNFIKGSEIQPGDTAIIKDEAVWVEGDFKGQKNNQYLATVDYKGQESTLKFTKLSRSNMQAFGHDSVGWIGKKISLKAADIMVDGKMHKTIVVEPFGSGIDQPGAGPSGVFTPEQQAKVNNNQPWDE